MYSVYIGKHVALFQMNGFHLISTVQRHLGVGQTEDKYSYMAMGMGE